MSASETGSLWKHCVVILLLVAGAALVVSVVEIRLETQAGVAESLPGTLGDEWVGDSVLFCHNPACGRSWLTREVSTGEGQPPVCPEDWQGNPCGAELHTMSLGEHMILPKDTVILKKKYQHQEEADRSVFCSVVFSGEHRTSIHRPETCMVGQGHTIEHSTVIEVPLEGREPLKVMVLHLTRRIGPQRFQHNYYAYWFVGKDRETPYHHQRMIWMALDKVLRNVSHRWAYISVSGTRDPDLSDTGHYTEIREIVSRLYPEIHLTAPAS
jgi:hypothetical protein